MSSVPKRSRNRPAPAETPRPVAIMKFPGLVAKTKWLKSPPFHGGVRGFETRRDYQTPGPGLTTPTEPATLSPP